MAAESLDFFSGKFIESQFCPQNFRGVPTLLALLLITTFFKRRKLSMMSLSRITSFLNPTLFRESEIIL
jgi:uncharacterized membrane protein